VIDLHRAMFLGETQFRNGSHEFCTHENFFLFLVGRNSANLGPACPRKSFAGSWLACGGGAKLTEFRPGGGAKLHPGEAKFVKEAIADLGLRIVD
jgi:hypothetical protein